MSGIKEDVTVGGLGGGYGYGGGMGSGIWIFAILIVFVILAIMFGSRGHGFDGDRGGHWGGLMGNCAPMCKPVEDVAVAGIAKEVAFTSGRIETQNAKDTGAIIHALDMQTCDIKIMEKDIMQQASQIAAEQAVAALNMKIADLRDENLGLKGLAMHEKTMQAIGAQAAATNAHIASVQCELNHRLDFIPTKQPVFAASVTPCTTPVSFPFGGFDRDRGFERGERREGCGC